MLFTQNAERSFTSRENLHLLVQTMLFQSVIVHLWLAGANLSLILYSQKKVGPSLVFRKTIWLFELLLPFYQPKTVCPLFLWPLTSTRPSIHTNLAPWIFFRTIIESENLSRSAVSETLAAARLAPTTVICSQTLKSFFFNVPALGLTLGELMPNIAGASILLWHAAMSSRTHICFHDKNVQTGEILTLAWSLKPKLSLFRQAF